MIMSLNFFVPNPTQKDLPDQKVVVWVGGEL